MSDLKGTTDSSAREFGKSAANFRYDVQGGWYPYVIRCLSGDLVQQFNFVCVEWEQPHAVGIYELDPDDFVAGLREARANLRVIADCMATNIWPDYGMKPTTLELPFWYRRERAQLGR